MGWTAAVMALVSGCGTGARIDAGRAYPIEKPQMRTLNIQVLRDETQIRLTNTSAEALPASTVWLNRQYGLETTALEIGQSATFPLGSFTNEFGERFRAGGFFATEKPAKLVQAQWELEGEMLGLIVVAGR